MKLIKTFQRLKAQILVMLPNNEIYYKSFIPLGFIALLAEVIWLIGPYITWGDYAPLVHIEKRIYIILFLFLVWLLKFLVLDLDLPNPQHYKDIKLRKKLQELQNRFYGAIQFLHKTSIIKQNKSTSLENLPWYLFIGPAQSGKTTLLLNANANFILQRQFQNKNSLEVESSEHCDWWVTRDTSIIDVPGKYIATLQATPHQKSLIYPIIWQFLLRLIKKQRGNNGVHGIVIALPLAEIMKQNDPKIYQTMLNDLFQQLHELQKFFPRVIPCQLLLTKCDLLPGFAEFFAESTQEEINQSWGISLPKIKKGGEIANIFSDRFDLLIKKLNQQLLWRLHHERNPIARPYIKDFPLQVQGTKEYIIDFIKKFSAENFNLALHGLYLTSALQQKPDPESNIMDQAHASTRTIQIFKAPSITRAYFIKQLFTHVFVQNPTTASIHPTLSMPQSHWKPYAAYSIAAGIIIIIATLLGRDFQQGIQQAYAIQHHLADYKYSISTLHDPDERLDRTLRLLNSLHYSVNATGFKLDLSHFLSFYSNKSQQKTNEFYQQALHHILLPEIKSYFEFYLQHPVNKNAEDIYAVLKAYLMLGDPTYYDPTYIANMMDQIQPKIIRSNQSNLLQHVSFALRFPLRPLLLEQKTIQEARQFLTALPGLKLSYIILKNLDKNNAVSEISILKNLTNPSLLINDTFTIQIPNMFTARAFTSIFNQEIAVAAQEATMGNWVLGNDITMIKNPVASTVLTEQLKTTYIAHYIEVWEKIVSNLHLSPANNLDNVDEMIINLISTHSPILQLLQTLHENTYFEPIATTSTKLQRLGLLFEKEVTSQNQLYEIFAGLQALHQYLQPVLTSGDEKKTAFEIVSRRMLNRDAIDAITQLRFIAAKNPDPIKNWLNKIADDSWHLLMREAGRYLDTSWQNQVIPAYTTDIAERYPFAAHSNEEVEIKKFIHFFGNPGIVLNFYNQYLQPFIDTSTSEWHWKKIDNQKLALSDNTLRQIHYAMRIHHAFFPHADNKLSIQFALQPYKFAKNIKRVKLNINDNHFIDEQNNLHKNHSHIIAWPSDTHQKMTSVQLTLLNQQTISRHFPGDWGWFKLVNQSFETMITKKEMVINFSQDEHPAKYLMLTETQHNPFMSVNLQHFQFSPQLIEN